jgi:peptide/nickel transport system substrate-binding protein
VLPANVSRNLLVNREKPPFDNPDIRRAMSLSLDRKTFIDILYEGRGEIGGAMQPPPAGLWGLPAEKLQMLPGYTPDVEKNRAEAREIMQKLGYGPDKRLPVTVSTRDVSYYRDPAVILIDQLKQIYMDGELQPVDTANWYPKVMRKDYTVGMNVTESEVDDPDVLYYENYACGAARNYTGYCNPEVDKLINQQSIETDVGRRKQPVWQIERKLIEDDARPVIFFPRGAVCRSPSVKGLTLMVNSIYDGQRFEDLWLDN